MRERSDSHTSPQPVRDAHQIVIGEARRLTRRASELGDDGTNDLAVSEILRTNELQTWFSSEHMVNVPWAMANEVAAT